ncbi:MAG: hypothetical protein FWD68_03750 [Alphaproteobacteria bacterium]|nr:hypothetical protein [Alphaproteobacteria bacterium]
MTLEKKGRFWYGTTVEDVKAEIVRFSRESAYPAVKFAQSRCGCGSVIFRLESDEDEGAARRFCVACGTSHWMGDSADYADGARFVGHTCVCDHEQFMLLSGVALYEGSNDVRWYTIGCLCMNCRLVGVFAEWKCEAGDADAFLSRI